MAGKTMIYSSSELTNTAPRFTTPPLTRQQASERWLYLFVAVQFALQSALLLESFGARWRLGCRATLFASSLFMLAFLPGRIFKPHPSRLTALAMLGLMGLGLLHPDANHLSGIAHWLLNIAIWAPLFWLGRISVTPRTIWIILLMLWGFNVASSVMGVLQVYYPDRFAPSAEFVRAQLGIMAEGLLVELADGRQIWRPSGLSDTPGGASASGYFAVLFGMFALTTNNPRNTFRTLAICGIAAGSFCIYFCEIRSTMLVTILSAVTMVGILILQGRMTRAAASLILIPIIIAGGFSWTSSLSGGNRIAARISSLAAGSATAVYYQNRGHFIEHSLMEELPKYPLGAGLGRYGMMYAYFGDPSLINSQPLWAEVQLTAWLYDGGPLLVLLGYLSVVLACLASFRISLKKNVEPLILDSAAIITALNIGWLAVTFNYPLFLGQSGIIFWLLNAALFTAYIQTTALRNLETSEERVGRTRSDVRSVR